MKHLLIAFAFVVALVAASDCHAGRASRGGRHSKAEEKEKPKRLTQTEPVAAGFPAWTGFDGKLLPEGRDLGPSDLRGRFVVVATIEGGSIVPQFQKVMSLQGLGFNPNSRTDWDFGNPRREVLVIVNVKQGEGRIDKLKGNEKVKKEFGARAFNIYSDVTFQGAPDAGGSYPFVYVMPPEGMEPIFKGGYDKELLKKVKSAIGKAEHKPWRPYYGLATPSKANKPVETAIEGGKSLVQALSLLRKGIGSRNPDLARESQLLFDGIMQTVGDMVYNISKEWKDSPHSALCDFEELSRRFPPAKEEVELCVQKASALPDVANLVKTLALFRRCANQAFAPKSASEADKLAGELRRCRPQLEKLRNSKTVPVQSAAFRMLGMIDELAGSLQARTEGR